MQHKKQPLAFAFLLLCHTVPPATVYGAHHGQGQHHGHEVDNSVTLETVVVSGERVDEYIVAHPQQVTLLDREAIRAGQYMDLTEAVGSMLGVDVRQAEGSMQTRISIRGSSGSGNTLVLVNGRPLNTSQYGGVELSSIPVDAVRRVTVFKPPIPVWLGPGGTAGAINIETEESGLKAASSDSGGQMKIGGGSYGSADLGLTYRRKQENGGLMLVGGAGHRDGKRNNSDKDNINLSLHWDRTSAAGTSFLLDGRSYFSDHGVSGPIYNPTPDARQRYGKGGLDFQVKGATDSGDYSVKTYLDIIRLEDNLQDGDESTLDTVKSGLKGEYVLMDDESQWALRLSGLAEHDTVDHTLSGDHDRQQVSWHSQLDREFAHFSLTAGLRADYVSDFDLFPAGFLGGSWTVSPSTLVKLNSGYSVKIPSFGQLYQPSHGSMDHVRGNPDLGEEGVWSYTLSVEQNLGEKQVFQASLFRSDHHDLIAYQRGDDLVTRPLNVDEAYRQGIELSLKYRLLDIDVDCSYIFQESNIDGTGRALTYTPEHKAKIILKYTVPEWRTRWETSLQVMSEQYSDVVNRETEKLDSQFSLDLKVTHPLELAGRSAEVFLKIKNLTDSDYAFHYGYPDDGLRGQLGLNMKF